MHPSEVKTAAPFNELFGIDEGIIEAIAQNMREYGFDTSQAIVLWDGKDLVVDGHTRLEAAKRAELPYVCTVHRKFRGEDDALAYAIHNQRNRRNITEAELLRCIAAVDKRREQREIIENQGRDAGGKFRPLPSTGGNGEKSASAKKTAKIVGTSCRKVERARVVLSDPEEKDAVMAGKKSINRASQDAKEKRQPTPPETEPVVTEPDKRQEVLLQAWEELMAWRRKYGQYPEFEEIFRAMEALVEKGEVVRERNTARFRVV